MFNNPEQDSKWECYDCGEVWYNDYTFYYECCINCDSKSIEEN